MEPTNPENKQPATPSDNEPNINLTVDTPPQSAELTAADESTEAGQSSAFDAPTNDGTTSSESVETSDTSDAIQAASPSESDMPAGEPIVATSETPAPPATTTEMPASGAIVAGGMMAGATMSGRPATASGRKKKLLLVLVPVLVILLAVGGVFGLYLPNKPENVFKRGLSRTGQAVDDLATKAVDTATTSKYKRTNVEGNLKFDSPSTGTYAAKINGWGSSKSADLNTTVSMKEQGLAAKNLAAHFLADVPSGKQYPDVYLQLSGLSQLGLDSFYEGVNQYDGKWLYLSSDYLQSAGEMFGADAQSGGPSDITKQDVTNFVKSMTKVSRDYVFTSDANKGILENRKFMGKETIDGVKTNHYLVGFNKAHVKQFCGALSDAVFNTQIVKKEVKDSAERTTAKKSLLDGCQSSANDIKQSDTFEMWVGGKYGLVRQVRIYDTDTKKDYVDIGQQYNGGDTISLYTNVHIGDSGSKGEVHGSFAYNTKTDAMVFDASAKGTGDDKFSLTAHLTVTPANGSTKITKPKDTIDIGQLLTQLDAQASQQSAQSETMAQTAEWYTNHCMDWNGQTSISDADRATAAAAQANGECTGADTSLE